MSAHYRVGAQYIGIYGDGAEPTEPEAVWCPAPQSASDLWSGESWQPRIDWPAAIAARRYDTEVSGITVAGMSIDTDDRSKLLINGAAVEAMLDPDYSMQWKTPAGFVELNAAQVLGVARAVRAHVQACFDREADLLAMGDAVTLDDLVTGWPEN